MNLDKELIESVLRNHGHSYTVQRVVSMEYEDALGKGENYLSIIYRITLKVILGNGRPAKKSLILKVAPQEKNRTDINKDVGAFKCETMMYTTVLREMEMLMVEFGETNDPLWCNLIHYEPYNSLLFDDLKTSGFSLKKRQECLDLDHTRLVLQSLGRFHAMAKILEERGVISKEDYKVYPIVSNRTIIKNIVYNCLKALTIGMEKHWGPEWFDVAQKLKIPCEVLQEKLISLGKIDENGFNSLNHGDCWSNNMMFKYDWQNRPYTMRFVDYQVAHYNSVGFDLERVLYLASQPSMRKENLGTMLRTYHSSLQDTLRFYGYKGNVPSLEWLHMELERLAFVGCLESIWKFITCSDNPDTWNIELFIESDGAEGIELDAYNNKYVRSMTEDVIKTLANVHFPAASESFKSLIPNSKCLIET